MCMLRRIFLIFFVLAATADLLLPEKAAASECGLSCCIAGAAEGIGAGGKGLNVNLQYEWMKMGMLLEGKDEKSPDEILSTKMMFSVPTEMIMQKMTANLAYGLNEKVSLLASIPYVRNDMDMKMKMSMPMPMTSDMTMDTIEGLGDVTLMAFYRIYADADTAPTVRITAGAGVKAPTGEYEKRENGELVHMMMQPGTGSWDPLLVINGMKAFGRTYLLGTATYQFTTENDRGYEVGDRLTVDIAGKYRLTDLFNLTLALNYVHSDKDKTDGSIDPQSPAARVNYQNPMMSLMDNVENTGLDSYFISPGLEFKPSAGSPWAFNASAKIPVYQKANGTQLVTDSWYVANASYRF